MDAIEQIALTLRRAARVPDEIIRMIMRSVLNIRRDRDAGYVYLERMLTNEGPFRVNSTPGELVRHTQETAITIGTGSASGSSGSWDTAR